jgi:hypothetical protein
MVFISNIYDLQYYKGSPLVPCYCESLTAPSDMVLQGDFVAGNIQNFSLSADIDLLSPDGLTVYEADIEDEFDIWYGVNPQNGRWFFNARLKNYTPEMCVRKCFILHVIIRIDNGVSEYNVFNKYTERYCQQNCCDTARGVISSQQGLVSGNFTQPPALPSTSPLIGECGETLIRLVSKFDCYDNFSGQYYATPPVVLQGTPSFDFVKISTINARIVPRQKEIKREISYNCVLQRTEAANAYLLESKEIYPAWKMLEIQNQFTAPEIWVEDYPNYKQYQFTGGTIFEKPEGLLDCLEYFKLSATLEDCIVRQVFGCPESCVSTIGAQSMSSFFVVPDNYIEGNNFYNDARDIIAVDIDGLLEWLRTQPNVLNAELMAASPIECSYTAIIGIAGNGGYLPTSIYYNTLSQGNRIYAVTVDDLSDICELIPQNQCATPVIGQFEIVPIECATPVLGTPEYTPVTGNDVELIDTFDWEFVLTGSPATPEDTSAIEYNNQVLLNFKVRNYSILDPTIELNNIIIGNVGAGGRPPQIVVFAPENTSSLEEGQYVSIDEYGAIRYTGTPTNYSLGAWTEIKLVNLAYNI